MSHTGPDRPVGVTRRRALALGGGVAGGLLATGGLAGAKPRHQAQRGKLPAKEIERIVQAEGTVTSGVLSIDLARDDIGDVQGPGGVTFTPAFEVDGTLTFQPLGGGRAFFNGDLALKQEETNAFIDAIVANGLIFQAFHQHYDQSSPQRSGSSTGAAPGPRSSSRRPCATCWGDLHPAAADDALQPEVAAGRQAPGQDPRRAGRRRRRGRGHRVGLPQGQDGDRWHQRLSGGEHLHERHVPGPGPAGKTAAVAPDFSMTAREIGRVVPVMRSHDWHVGCLYTQETHEHPQLYFAHMVKTGDPYTLAREVRQGIDQTNA